MNKTAIKSFAMWARVNLIKSAKKQAYEYGITKNGENIKSLKAIGDRLLTSTEIAQRCALIEIINQKGFDEVMEDAAYTWFIRFIALRFMEVNEYLPSHIRIFTNKNDDFTPEIVDRAITVEFDNFDRNKNLKLTEGQNKGELYKYLLITQCNALESVLPDVFKKIPIWAELLFPSNILDNNSILGRLIFDIPKEDFADIEIIGWMHQYYITELHERIINPLHNKPYTKEEIPAATQIFTTEWVVKYIVDNSLGRYWIERNPHSEVKSKLKYLVIPKSGRIDTVNESIHPYEITILDPCVGSGHFLSYAFEVLMMIYTECGWSERDAAKSIIERNLYGLDIDARAAHLAYFTLMMKSRKYNHEAFSEDIAEFRPNIYAIKESNNIDINELEKFINGNINIKAEMDNLLCAMHNATEYGSILNIQNINFELLLNHCKELDREEKNYQSYINTSIIPLIKAANLMSKKYNIVVTNPPYMNKYSHNLKAFINKHYAAYKGDMFSVFMYKCFEYCKPNGYTGAMTPMVWMFIRTYENLRKYILQNHSITSLIQFEYSAFDEATVPICSFIFKCGKSESNGCYFKLSDFHGGMEVQREKTLEAIDNKDCGYYYEAPSYNFSKISGSPIAYWASEGLLLAFDKGRKLGDCAITRNGMKTGDNATFLRLWWEIEKIKFATNINSYSEAINCDSTWFPYNKGGEYRKWYGNNDYVVNWKNCGERIFNYAKIDKRNVQDYPAKLKFSPSLSWSLITSGKPAFRYKECNLSDIAGMSLFTDKQNVLKYLALLNSNVALEILQLIAPTINFQSGDIARIPIVEELFENEDVISRVETNIQLSKNDWDSFETSWDFKKHPLV